MKKLLIIIAIFVFPFFVFAKEVEIEDINLKFNLNDDYILLTRDNLDNNADLKKLGIAENYMKNTMEKNNIYADILTSGITYEILVVVPDIRLSFYNLNDATDSMLVDLKNELVKKTGAETSSIYKSKHNYVIVDYFDEKTDYYIVNYYTIVNAKGYNFQLQKKTEITQEEKEEFKVIIDSVDISNITNDSNSGINFKTIIIGAVIGATVGLVSYLISSFMKKKVNESENKSKKKKLTIEDDNK